MKISRPIALLGVVVSTGAFAQDNLDSELQRMDLLGAPGMEVVTRMIEIPPGGTLVRHTHPGVETGYVIEGGTIQLPSGESRNYPAGRTFIFQRDVPHAGFKNFGDKPLKLIYVLIVDKGKPPFVEVK